MTTHLSFRQVCFQIFNLKKEVKRGTECKGHGVL
uniref:Uncharacterized protein n=1 Tax=Lepeophtheirus salmonis TaxID=72036 RepID=A0A0K2VJK6_LEPSM